MSGPVRPVLPGSVSRVFVANRGEIAVRIIRACQGMGLETVVGVSEADRDTLGARLADRAVCVGPAAAADSYLSSDRLLAAALGTGCDALHPGYGFLSESAQFAQRCAQAGMVFVGPLPEQIQRMGNKLEARALAQRAGVPMLPGSALVRSPAEAGVLARGIGYPVMLKAAAGGGGRGMKIVGQATELEAAFTAAAAEARAAFGDASLYLERYLVNARHIEVQVLGDQQGNIVHLGERDCSLQRRHQKLVEESPAPGITPELRRQICEVAVALARSIGYQSAGTVEFIVDQDARHFYFLEMNTRIQVEHPVTEMVTGIDLVQQQLRIARAEPLPFSQADIVPRGHAIECRINAESPSDGFRPSPGLLTTWSPPQGPNIRVDTHCYAGYRIPPFYDSLIAKTVVYGSTRAQAIERMRHALARFGVAGVHTTLPFLQSVLASPTFGAGRVNTQSVDALLLDFAAAQAAGETV